MGTDSPAPLQIKKPPETRGLKVERVIGVEPTTLCLASIRSSQLSYTRMVISTTATDKRCQFQALLWVTLACRNRKN
jgi:hypothetical protein